MSCCGKRKDEVDVSDAVRIRFPKINNAVDLISAIRYSVAKCEGVMSSQRGVMKASIVVNIVDLLVDEVASEELKEIYTLLGGRTFVEHTINMLCHASKGKKISKGV
jgi:hypothetical protein